MARLGSRGPSHGENTVKIALLARLILAGVFLYAGWDKILHPASFTAQVAAYGLLPSELLTLVALTLPWLEVLAGVCLLVGFLSESSALVLGLLSLGFAGAVTSANLRGLDIECGCFSTTRSGPADWNHVLLDLALVALAAVVLTRGPGPWALDRLLPPDL